MTLASKIIKAVLIIILIGGLITVGYLVINPNQGEGFTEFYILDHNNNTTDYPMNVTQNSIEKINIGIKNNEYKDMNYTVKVLKNGTLLTMYNKTLHNNEESITPFYLDRTRTGTIGPDQELDIQLFIDNSTNPYRTLKLRYNVV